MFGHNVTVRDGQRRSGAVEADMGGQRFLTTSLGLTSPEGRRVASFKTQATAFMQRCRAGASAHGNACAR